MCQRPNGYVFYRGKSMLRPEHDIVCIVTGTRRASRNPKTGPMLQTWVLLADEPPTVGAHRGTDSAVCGNCPLRGRIIKSGRRTRNAHRRCYVTLGRAPTMVWSAFQAGAYPEYEPDAHQQYLLGKPNRLGAYGDPAALPLWCIDKLHLIAGGQTTGYTHQWRVPRVADYREYLMASVETAADAALADQLGWRYFRVMPSTGILNPGEILCPASAEAGMRTTCSRCQLCAGCSKRARNVAIYAHGSRNMKAQINQYLYFIQGAQA